MTVTQTLEVVHGLMNTMKVVMEGAQHLSDRHTFLSPCHIRWQGFDERYSTDLR